MNRADLNESDPETVINLLLAENLRLRKRISDLENPPPSVFEQAVVLIGEAVTNLLIPASIVLTMVSIWLAIVDEPFWSALIALAIVAAFWFFQSKRPKKTGKIPDDLLFPSELEARRKRGESNPVSIDEWLREDPPAD